MSEAGRAQAQGTRPIQRLFSGALSSNLPSWLASVAIHGTMLLIFASGLKSCGDGSLGVAESDFREVGIHLKQSDSPTETPDDGENPLETPTVAEFSEQNPLDSDVDSKPPVDVLLPSVEQIPIIGRGMVPDSVVPHDVSKFSEANSFRSAAAAAGTGPGKAEFFNIHDKGVRFVYVLDCSGSMQNHNAIGVAKSELMASLHGLNAQQQFQVIFYNRDPHIMSHRGNKDGGLYWATDINRTLSERFVNQIQPDLGTVHLPALMSALGMDVDVIFFLTDAGTEMRASELAVIKRKNQGRSRIHCIEFGVRARLSGLDDVNFLQQLAEQSGGSYRYCDVTKFGRK